MALHPGRMMEKPERQPYIHWTTCYDFEETRNIELCSYRETEKLKTVLELYKTEIHQKKAGLDYHSLKTMVRRSIEQNLRIKNFEARNGNFETSAVVKNQGQNRVNKELQEIVGSGKPTGSVLKRTIVVSVTILISVQKQHSRILLRVLSCKRMREMRREPEVPEAKVPVEECFDCPTRITSKELAPLNSVKNGTSRMLVLQVGERMQIWGKVLLCTSPG